MTACTIHTFDCTVAVPKPPRAIANRVVFHRVCLDASDYTSPDGREFRSLPSLLTLAGGVVPILFKMDIEGYEWAVMHAMVEAGVKHREKTGEDIIPDQIAVEVHYANAPWTWRAFEKRDLLVYFNHLFFKGGYVLAQRRDNLECASCSDFLLVKAMC